MLAAALPVSSTRATTTGITYGTWKLSVTADAAAKAAGRDDFTEYVLIEADGITISHGPIASLKWPSMTMGFGKPGAKAFADIRTGDTVRFEFKKGGPMDYELVSVQRVGDAK